jgi:hypothetical protein
MPKVESKTEKNRDRNVGFISRCYSKLRLFTVGLNTASGDFVFFGFLVVMLPITHVNYVGYLWRKVVDEQLPDLTKCSSNDAFHFA